MSSIFEGAEHIVASLVAITLGLSTVMGALLRAAAQLSNFSSKERHIIIGLAKGIKYIPPKEAVYKECTNVKKSTFAL